MSTIGIIGFSLTATMLFRVFFSSKEDFFDCIRYCFTPDLWSILKGEFHQDFYAEVKIFLWLGLSVLMGFGLHQLFSE